MEQRIPVLLFTLLTTTVTRNDVRSKLPNELDTPVFLDALLFSSILLSICSLAAIACEASLEKTTAAVLDRILRASIPFWLFNLSGYWSLFAFESGNSDAWISCWTSVWVVALTACGYSVICVLSRCSNTCT